MDKEFLEKNNLKGKTIFLDVDGTIIADKENNLDDKIFNVLKELNEKNNLYLCSNKSEVRAKKIAELIGCKYIPYKKPFPWGYKKIIRSDGLELKNIVVVGDKYLTDGLLAKFLGVDFLKTKRIYSSSDSFGVKISYFIDDIFYFLTPYIVLIRPLQSVKNLIVFAPIFFAVRISDLPLLFETFLTFIIFCLASWIIYIINDILDKKYDSLHPQKRYRPITLGVISIRNAIIFAFLIFITLIYLIYKTPSAVIPVSVYIFLNILYSLFFKNIVVLDIIFVSLFYILRVIAGGLGGKIYISPWIIICVFFGSLFIIIGKRRAEYYRENKRIVLLAYSSQALDFMLVISSTLSIVSYGVWSAIEHGSPYLVYSTIFVVFIFFRIINYLFTRPHEVETPEILVFKDKLIFFSFLLWLIYVFCIFYFNFL